MFRSLLALLFIAGGAFAKGERSGDFDYYVLALSWTPSWCETQGDARNSEQCDIGRGYGFTLHGLWPQYPNGWPSYCPTPARQPSRMQTSAMADIMGSSGLAWHQWKKHGVCSGLSASDYFDLSRTAYERINRPEILRQLTKEVNIRASVIKEAYLEANPNFAPDQLEVTCKAGNIQEVRICLSKDLEPTRCTTRRASCDSGLYDLAPIR